MKHLLLSIFILMNSCCSTFSLSSWTGSKSTALELSNKSTALDVLKILNNSGRLAPYAKENAGGVAVVTGGNSGIGKVSVEVLALAGMKVVLCSRDVSKGEEARSSMSAKENIRVQKLDLTDLDSVKNAVKDIESTEGSVDVLLLNAGVMATPYELTKNGFELQIGTNHIAHHYMTRLLLPSIKSGGRIVSVASTAHSMGDIDTDDLNYKKGRNYTPWGSYGQSKMANILFAKSLTDKLQEVKSDILSVSLHPGVIKTELWRYGSSILRFATNLIADKSIEQGAATNVFCSLVDSSSIKGGEYFMDCAEASPNNLAQDNSKARRSKLWSTTEELIAEAGFHLPKKLL